MTKQQDETTAGQSEDEFDMRVTVSNTSADQSTMASTITGGSIVSGGGIVSGAIATLPTTGYPTTGYTYTIPVTAAGGSGYYSIGSGISFSMPPKTSIVSFTDTSGKEVVRINLDGTVTWSDGIKIDEAAAAMAKSLSLSTELYAGITKAVKLRMRDSVFEDIIEIAKQKGSLTAEDLTYLLEASKIVEKLKGAKD